MKNKTVKAKAKAKANGIDVSYVGKIDLKIDESKGDAIAPCLGIDDARFKIVAGKSHAAFSGNSTVTATLAQIWADTEISIAEKIYSTFAVGKVFSQTQSPLEALLPLARALGGVKASAISAEEATAFGSVGEFLEEMKRRAGGSGLH